MRCFRESLGASFSITPALSFSTCVSGKGRGTVSFLFCFCVVVFFFILVTLAFSGGEGRRGCRFSRYINHMLSDGGWILPLHLHLPRQGRRNFCRHFLWGSVFQIHRSDRFSWSVGIPVTATFSSCLWGRERGRELFFNYTYTV